MRISLLQMREPIASIVEQTLARFWTAQFDQSYQVCWRKGRPAASNGIDEQQIWLVNAYLNAIFCPGSDGAIFDPIRREFSHSLIGWRRLAQLVYVATATSGWGAPRLAQAHLVVKPAVPKAGKVMVVAGNHKLRLLDLDAGLAYGLAKVGFRSEFFEREIRARRRAKGLSLPVPELVAVGQDGSWFSEAYVSGTPVNRLKDTKAAAAAVVQAVTGVARMVEESRVEGSLGGYLEGLVADIEGLIDENHLLNEEDRRSILAQAAALVSCIEWLPGGLERKLVTAETHGDFQPANILVNEENVWLIDWEYSDRRQAGYDGLVLNLSSRFPYGLAGRLAEFVATGWPANKDWPGLDISTGESRLRHGALFLLEELALKLAENAEPTFTVLDQGIQLLRGEICHWLERGK